MAKTQPPRSNNADEWRAYEATAARLEGFDADLVVEAIDGRLCALAAGPVSLAPEVWLPALFGDTWERVFADPEDHAGALASLKVRLAALQDQLNPEALIDDPENLRLDPAMDDWTDELRQAAIDAGEIPAEKSWLFQTGVVWADAFVGAVNALSPHWPMPEDPEFQTAFDDLMAQVQALFENPAEEPYAQHLARYWNPPERLAANGGVAVTPTREELLAEALFSVQDIRLLWVDFAPVPETVRKAPQPGRNDPCPCGSGKKFKKCHGAAA